MGQVFHFAYLISDTKQKHFFKLWKNMINSDGRLLTSVQRISWIKNKNALRLM